MVVQRYLGHMNVTTTEVYASISLGILYIRILPQSAMTSMHNRRNLPETNTNKNYNIMTDLGLIQTQQTII